LQAPFTEINTKIDALKQQQSDTQIKLNALTDDELLTAEGIARKRSLTGTLTDIETAIEASKKKKIQIAKDNEPAARNALVEFYNTYRSDAEKASGDQYEKPIQDLLAQAKELESQQYQFDHANDEQYQAQAYSWFTRLYGVEDGFHNRLMGYHSHTF
jgi:septal ring factor EnvC (AmiA/AmiB activator)